MERENSGIAADTKSGGTGAVMQKVSADAAARELDAIVDRDLLYDFYGDLLTDHQKKIYEAVVFDDRSLSEAARDFGISRQGVSDLIRRVGEQLADYERKLGLVGKFHRQRRDIREIRRLTKRFEETKDEEAVRKISAIADKLLRDE